MMSSGAFYLMVQRTVAGLTWRFYFSRSGLPGTWHRYTTTGSKARPSGRSVSVRQRQPVGSGLDQGLGVAVDKVGS